jgi:hypothetical protein
MRRARADYTGTMTRPRSLIAVLCAIVALLGLPATAAAHAGLQAHGDPAAALPDSLITTPVLQDQWTSPTPGLSVDNERSGGLPEAWCGTETTTDDTVDQLSSDTGPHFKLLYAYASDQPDRFVALADKLQASVSLLTRYMAGQSGGAKTVRFDLGTSCGPQYVDIQTVALPQPQSYYVVAGVPNFTRLNDDVRAAVALPPGSRRNLLVYADALRGTDGVSGSAQRYTTLGVADAPGAGNPHNAGGLLAVAWGRTTIPSGTYAEPATLMHELSHNLGAVQGSAPHTTDPVNGGHCTDEQDLMCYADGGPNNTLTYPCDYRSGQQIDETFDCGRDDYFDPAPAPSSYLDTHWNLYNSEHLVSCTDPEAGIACGDADVTAPVNTTPAAGSGWYTAPYAVALSATDSESGVARMQWRVDGGGAVDASNGETITLSSSGVFTLETRAVDEAGNASAWRAETVRIDLSAPNDTTDPGTVAWRPTATSVTVTAADPLSGLDHVEWELDGGAVQSGPNASTVAIAGDGAHTLRTRAVDVAGNISSWRTHTIRVDTVTPTDDTAAPGGWQTGPLAVTVAGSDAHSGVAQVTYQLDGGAQTAGPSPTVVTVSGDGDHVLTSKVRDNAGNESGWKSTTVRIDTTAPANQTPTAPTAWRAADYAVMVSGADGGSGLNDVQWRVDGGPVTSGASPLQATVTGTGVHTFETRARDVAGNASAWRSETIRIDTLAPTNTTTAPSGPVANPYSVSVTGTDAHSGVDHVEFKIDGGAVQSGSSGTQATITGNGSHTLQTRVVDGAGNTSAWRTDTVVIDVSLNADTTPPTDTTTTVPAGWRVNPLTITVSATDAGAGMDAVQWRLPGKPIETRSGGSATLTFDTEGIYHLETRGRDLAGNVSQWRLQTVRLDFTVPTDTTAIPSGWSNSRSFAAAGADALSGPQTFEYVVDGGPLQTVAIGATVTVPSDGVFAIDHRVLDAAGQTSDWHTDTLRVDTVLPANTSAVPDPAWRPGALSLDLSGTDATSGLATMQWRLNGSAIHDGGPAVINTDGEYLLETRALDQAGNASAWRSDTVRVDVTAPVNDTPAAPAGWRSTPYTVQVQGSDGAGAGVDAIEVKVDGGTVSTDPDVTISGDGVHTLATRIIDLVGHASVWRSETIRIDSVVPTATLSCPAGWNARAVSCTATANGGASGIASLTASRDGGAYAAVTGGVVLVATDGDHALALKAIDGAGNVKTVTARVKVDRTAPVAALSCAPASAPTGYACRATGSDATSGVAALTYSLDGGAWTRVPASGAFSVSKGTLRVRAVDAAGNQALTAPATLADRAEREGESTGTVRISSAPVYLAGHTDKNSLVGAIRAARSANGTVSVDLRPLAVGRGRYKVAIALKSGEHHRTLRKTYTVGRDGTLPRIAASLSRATAKTTVTLTVRKQSGRSWRRYAIGKVVLAG